MLKLASIFIVFTRLSLSQDVSVQNLLECLKTGCGNSDTSDTISLTQSPTVSFPDLASILPTITQSNGKSSEATVAQIVSTFILDQPGNGILVLESGDGSMLNWYSSPTNQSSIVALTDLQHHYVSDFAKENPDPVSSLPIYPLDPKLYTGDFNKPLFLPSPNSIYFELVNNELIGAMDICSSSSLVFVVVNLDGEQTDPNIVLSGNASLVLSNQFVRLCPIVMQTGYLNLANHQNYETKEIPPRKSFQTTTTAISTEVKVVKNLENSESLLLGDSANDIAKNSDNPVNRRNGTLTGMNSENISSNNNPELDRNRIPSNLRDPGGFDEESENNTPSIETERITKSENDQNKTKDEATKATTTTGIVDETDEVRSRVSGSTTVVPMAINIISTSTEVINVTIGSTIERNLTLQLEEMGNYSVFNSTDPRISVPANHSESTKTPLGFSFNQTEITKLFDLIAKDLSTKSIDISSTTIVPVQHPETTTQIVITISRKFGEGLDQATTSQETRKNETGGFIETSTVAANSLLLTGSTSTKILDQRTDKPGAQIEATNSAIPTPTSASSTMPTTSTSTPEIKIQTNSTLTSSTSNTSTFLAESSSTISGPMTSTDEPPKTSTSQSTSTSTTSTTTMVTTTTKKSNQQRSTKEKSTLKATKALRAPKITSKTIKKTRQAVSIIEMSTTVLKAGSAKQIIQLAMQVENGLPLSVSSCALTSATQKISIGVSSLNNFNCTVGPFTAPSMGNYSLECDVAVNGEPVTLVAPKLVTVIGESLPLETTPHNIDLNLTPTTTATLKQTTEGSTSTSSDVPLAQVQFNDDLLGLTITTTTGDYFPVGYLNCSNVYMDPARLGVNATCMGTGNRLLVAFGTGATLLPGQPFTLRTSFFTSKLFAAMPTLTVLPPDNPISPSFIVDYPSTVTFCQPIFQVNLRQLSGHGKRPLSFQWVFVHDSPFIQALASEAFSRNISIPTMELQSDNLTIGVTACNFVGKCTTVNDITIFVDDQAEGVFEVAISGGGEVYPSMRIILEAVPSYTFCGSLTPTSPLDTHYIWYENGTIVSRAGSFKISPYRFSVGDNVEYRVAGSYSTNETSYRANTTLILNFVAEPLIVAFDSYQLTVPSDQSIYIDASQSKDSNTVDGILSHSWSCYNLSSNSTCSIGTAIQWNSSILLIPPGYLNEDMSFSFTDFVSGSGLNSSVSSIVTVITPKTPKIRFVPFSQGKINVQDYVRIQSFVSSSYGSLNTSWEVVTSEKYGWFDLNAILAQNWKSFGEDATQLVSEVLISLTIPPAIDNWPGLLPGTTYAVVLVASNSAGTASSLFEFQTNSPPIAGNLDINPSTGISALSLISLSMGDGWIDPDGPLMFRFGIRTMNIDNSTTVNWNRQSMNSAYNVYLATAGPWANAGCGKRVGYTALIEVCDRLSACTVVESPKFTVSPPQNVTALSSDILDAISSDMANEMTFSALEKLDALTNERCNGSLTRDISNKVALELLNSLDDTSSNDEYREVLNAVTQMLGSVDQTVIQLLSSAMTRYQIRLMSPLSVSSSSRTKRDIPFSNFMSTPLSNIDEGIFVLCDRLLRSGAITIGIYFQAIENALSNDCTKLDDTSERIIADQGEGFTYIQAQSLATSDPALVNETYTLAGSTKNKIMFRSSLASWNCEDGSTLCDFACLASASISATLFGINSNFSAYFFDNQYSALTANKSASNLYRVSIKDPLSGSDVNFVGTYRIMVPLLNYKASNYYNCFLFVVNAWSSRGCNSASFAIPINGSSYLSCSCTQTGIIGVFTVSPPTPSPVPIHNEIEIDLILSPNSTILASTAFLNHLATASGVDRTRLVQGNATAGEFSFILRPPISSDQLSNAYAVQAILRAIDPASTPKLFDSGVKLVDSSWIPIIRNLTGDLYARKVIARIERSYSQVIGNNTSLATKWSSSIAQALQISEYRIKNPQIYPGIVFNFTITVPFQQEVDPLSAEEISVMLIEATGYGELTLASSTGDSLPVTPLTEADIVILMVLESSNALAIGIVSGISLAVGLATIYVLGAVYVKLRTDKLIQLERERILMSNPVVPPPPQYPIAIAEPPLVQASGAQRRRNRSVTTNHR